MAKNIGKNISKNISSKYSQKLLDHAKESVADVLKTASKRVIQKAATATSDLIVSKIADVVAKSYDGKTKKVSKIIQRQLQMSMIKKKKDRKLLMIWD